MVYDSVGDPFSLGRYIKSKGEEFFEKYTANNPFSFQGVNAVYDELGFGNRQVNESALENNYNSTVKGMTFDDLLSRYKNGEITAKEFQELVAQNGIKLTGSQNDWLSSALSDQNTQEEYDRGIQSIIDSALATQEAAIQTGMNPTAYLMTQGAASNPGVSKAQADTQSAKAERLAKFERNTQIAKTLIGITGSMATSGIYGGAMYAAKSAAAHAVSRASRGIYNSL